jgi:octaprenyl-diphosphate synthase
MSSSKVIQKELNLVKKLIKNEIIEEKTISDLYKYIFNSNGKKLRAKLSLISSSLNKRKNHKRLKLAAVIELLHTATLIHDDVVDESQTRRGVKSVNNIWSNAHGVLIGDYIYSKAFILMVEIGETTILQELANATNDISKGELIQLDALQNTRISLEDLKAISYFKTGRLFEASAKTGAILAGGDKSFVNNISKCAKYLGILFQIKDDLLDYSLNEKIIGKPVFQDMKEGKVTYPFYFAYKNGDKKNKEKLKSYLGKNKFNINSAYKLIDQLGGIIETEHLAFEYLDKAKQSANSIKNKHIKEEMLKLIDSAIYRKK